MQGFQKLKNHWKPLENCKLFANLQMASNDDVEVIDILLRDPAIVAGSSRLAV